MLGHATGDFEADAGGFELSLENHPPITVEKVPERECIAISGLLCHYPDRERLFPLFEGLMNAHAFGVYTDNAYFSANSSLGQVIMHKLLLLDRLSPEGLRTEIEAFAAMLNGWRERYANGDIEGVAGGPVADKPAGILGGSLRA